MDISTSPKALVLDSIASCGFPLGHKFLGASLSQAGTDGYWSRGATTKHPKPSAVGTADLLETKCSYPLTRTEKWHFKSEKGTRGLKMQVYQMIEV
jgi:hypothetical protein